jgi:hypothetical protein
VADDGCAVDAVDGGREGDPPLSSACAELAQAPSILDRLDADLLRAGLVAARLPAARLIYLAVVSRLHRRPVSVLVKGSSSSGKSWLVRSVLDFHPPSAYHTVSAMSERSLAYGKEPLKHRVLVLFEHDGTGEFASYLLRSLLSEGELRYETVESGPLGLKPKVIHRAGPTALLSTSTAVSVHAENETRCLSVTLTDSPEAIGSVLDAWGSAFEGEISAEVNYAPWRALGSWLESHPLDAREVVIPFGRKLAGLLSGAKAPRLQRDFIQVGALIKAHALLHAATRERDSHGRIVATVDGDYAAVRPLVEPIVSAGVGASVKPAIRELVEAVATLEASTPDGVEQRAVAVALGLHKSVVSRRVKDAIADGYLRDLEHRQGRPARLVLAEELPADREVLPPVKALLR